MIPNQTKYKRLKRLKRNPNTFALCTFTLQLKYFLADDLLYIKKIQRIKEAGSAMDSVALPISLSLHYANFGRL